ncbi:hypothetical protein C5167_021496 [Papaver somniferum]|nr:hypothetical protein C5167_021496 [Papaver somniferum]
MEMVVNLSSKLQFEKQMSNIKMVVEKNFKEVRGESEAAAGDGSGVKTWQLKRSESAGTLNQENGRIEIFAGMNCVNDFVGF